MACLIITGITSNDCGFSLGGGLEELYIANKSEVSGIAKNSSGVITGTTTAAKFWKFEYEEDSSQIVQALKKSANKSVKQTLTFQIANVTQSKKEILEGLALGKFIVIAKDNGIWKLFGETGKGLRAPDGGVTIDTGKTEDDANIASITLEGTTSEYANEITSAAVALAIA